MEKQHRQEKIGVVTRTSMDKTIVVVVENTFLHPTYKRVVRKKRKFKAHDERNQCNINDIVRIVETRPLSKTKRWRLAEIIERAK
ncbi:MAG: 30S ribosomal protein S17 [Candidatus Abyssubacteria bacterium]